MLKIDNFFTSAWDFDAEELDLKSKFQMINVAIILSSIGLVFGIISNIIKDISGLIPLEFFLLSVNVVLFFTLRQCKKSFKFVSMVETVQFSFLFLFLVYVSEPSQLKHIWIFTYPIILLYFQNEKNATYWVVLMIFFLMLAPLQPFIEVSYSLFQVFYISVVLIIISIIIYFYQKKMDEAKDLILKQQEQLKITVTELTQKDKLLSVQSKQAVMGEMISMIAHQWRQPLSTVTLSISDLQVKKLLGTKIEDDLMDKTLQNISDTVVYLSDTIDDFQTYFQPNKEISSINISDLVNKAINFTKPRLEGSRVVISFENRIDEKIQTYTNELIQVILNILNNAIDELLELEKEDLVIIVSLKDVHGNIYLSIRDNANGIPLESLESIFEPYYSTKGKNGTGLGLYMSQMIMQKQFNSKIEVSSSKNGSIFSLRVPKKLS